jgi:hypothetical protein
VDFSRAIYKIRAILPVSMSEQRGNIKKPIVLSMPVTGAAIMRALEQVRIGEAQYVREPLSHASFNLGLQSMLPYENLELYHDDGDIEISLTAEYSKLGVRDAAWGMEYAMQYSRASVVETLSTVASELERLLN